MTPDRQRTWWCTWDAIKNNSHFQTPSTHPDFLRRKVCAMGTMTHPASGGGADVVWAIARALVHEDWMDVAAALCHDAAQKVPFRTHLTDEPLVRLDSDNGICVYRALMSAAWAHALFLVIAANDRATIRRFLAAASLGFAANVGFDVLLCATTREGQQHTNIFTCPQRTRLLRDVLEAVAFDVNAPHFQPLRDWQHVMRSMNLAALQFLFTTLGLDPVGAREENALSRSEWVCDILWVCHSTIKRRVTALFLDMSNEHMKIPCRTRKRSYLADKLDRVLPRIVQETRIVDVAVFWHVQLGFPLVPMAAKQRVLSPHPRLCDIDDFDMPHVFAFILHKRMHEFIENMLHMQTLDTPRAELHLQFRDDEFE